MHLIRQSIAAYSEFLGLLRPRLAAHSQPRLRLLLLGMLLLSVFSILLHYGWFMPGLDRIAAYHCLKYGTVFLHCIPLLGITGWIGIALGNLRWLPERGSGLAGGSRYLLLLHSGVVPVLASLLFSAATIGILLLISGHSVGPTWLGIHESWPFKVQHLQNELLLELWGLPSHILYYIVLTAIGLAVAITNRTPSVAWVVCGLLDMQLLFDIAASFIDPNIYALYWLDSLYRPGLLLLGFTGLAWLLLHIGGSERGFLGVAAVVMALRVSDLMFTFTHYGSFMAVHYDDVMKPIANLVWHLNIPFRFPVVGAQPGNYNPAFGFSASFGDGHLLGLFDQFQSGLYLGWEAYPLAWLGNLVFAAIVLFACLHSTARHPRGGRD